MQQVMGEKLGIPKKNSTYYFYLFFDILLYKD